MVDTNYLYENMNSQMQISMLRKQENGTYALRKFHQYSLLDYPHYIDLKKNMTGDNNRIFFINHSLLRPNDIFEDFETPEYANFLSLVYIGFSELPKRWEDRQAYYSDEERIVCSVYGREEYALVSPVYTQNMYVGLFEDLP